MGDRRMVCSTGLPNFHQIPALKLLPKLCQKQVTTPKIWKNPPAILKIRQPSVAAARRASIQAKLDRNHRFSRVLEGFTIF